MIPLSTPSSTETESRPQDAKLLAQFIAMAPFVFQTALCLRDFGILKHLCNHPEGLSFKDLLEPLKINDYSLSVLLDAGISSGILRQNDELYIITQTGIFLENDAITRVNMNFSQDVCYQGLFSLKDALQTNTPSGLKIFGDWSTIYEGLSSLPEKAQQSWFEFDHFFSDDCFQRALPILFRENPNHILDVGGNTGKFSIAATQFSPDVKVTIVDHISQVRMAKEMISKNGLEGRVHFHPADLLHPDATLPAGHDLIWMSQFLCCFSDEGVIKLLRMARESLTEGGHLFIMETFTDNQKFSTAKFCLDMTSLYFTAMANGNSRMYPLRHFLKLIEKAGLRVTETHSAVRINHTILKCEKAPEKSAE